MTKYYKKLGFTLAELVLSMAIMGVIALLTIPVIVGKSPNKEMIMFKKTYGVFSKAINDILNDEDLYPTGSLSDTSEVVYNGASYSGSSKFCGLLAAHLVARSSSCQGGGFADLTTVDGVSYSFYFNPSDNIHYIGIDVNTVARPHCRLGLVANEQIKLGINSCSSTAVKGTMFIVQVSNSGDISVASDGVEEKYLKATDNTKKYPEL